MFKYLMILMKTTLLKTDGATELCESYADIFNGNTIYYTTIV